MGKQLTGLCDCSYGGEVYIASGRTQHGKVFYYPHYCNSCDSLISVDLLSKSKTCKFCASDDVHSFEATSKTISSKSLLNKLPPNFLLKIGYHSSELVHEEIFCYPLNKKFVLLRGNHYCPKCKHQSMHFFTSMLYD